MRQNLENLRTPPGRPGSFTPGPSRSRRPKTASPLLLLVAVGTLATCTDITAIGGEKNFPPMGPDATQPFPIDRGDDPGTPGTYKGLWLRLVDNGQPSVTPANGVIGVVCIGMSNGNQECGDFIRQIREDLPSEVNPAVRVVNCAVGGHAIERWIDPAYDDVLWHDCVSRKIPAVGLHPREIRVLWHKAANQFTLNPDGSPKPAYPLAGSDYEAFLLNLDVFAQRVAVEFPSVQAVYTSSRSYGGYALNPARGEPLSYEEGHALNQWLAEHRSVQGVWYGWGPYLWGPDCGTGIRNGGGVCYFRGDYGTDGVHPSASGLGKVSGLLHARFLKERWYRP